MNFILAIEDVQNPKLLIAMNFGNRYISECQPISSTAFPLHPNCPGFYDGFKDYKDAVLAKVKWAHFLENYLKK